MFFPRNFGFSYEKVMFFTLFRLFSLETLAFLTKSHVFHTFRLSPSKLWLFLRKSYVFHTFSHLSVGNNHPPKIYDVKNAQKRLGPTWAILGRTRVSRALSKSPGVKKHGEQAGGGPGARFGRFRGWKLQKHLQNFLEKCEKFLGSGSGWEIDVFHVSGALRKTRGSEKRGEEARSGQGARILCFWT